MWEKPVKKTIFTLAIDNWQPEITELTFPLLKLYARKIGADFHVISERKYPDWPITYEKLQIYDLAQEMGNDWNIYIDADALVNPEAPDFTPFLPKGTVAHHGCDKASTRWKKDRFFLRDGRDISSCNWFTLASDWCIDLWHPVDDLTPEETIARCFPTVHEENTVVHSNHLIDDFILSRNIAKYGLEFTTLIELMNQIDFGGTGYFWHLYTIPPEQKVGEMKSVLRAWGIL